MKKFFSFDPLDNEFLLHDTEDEAKAAAQKAVDYAREDCLQEGEWNTDAGEICWGKLSQCAQAVDEPIPTEEQYGGPTTYTEYRLLDFPIL